MKSKNDQEKPAGGEIKLNQTDKMSLEEQGENTSEISNKQDVQNIYVETIIENDGEESGEVKKKISFQNFSEPDRVSSEKKASGLQEKEKGAVLDENNITCQSSKQNSDQSDRRSVNEVNSERNRSHLNSLRGMLSNIGKSIRKFFVAILEWTGRMAVRLFSGLVLGQRASSRVSRRHGWPCPTPSNNSGVSTGTYRSWGY